MGSAFVDVFMDDNAVSPTLVESCVQTWPSPESNTLSFSLVQLTNLNGAGGQDADEPAEKSEEGADLVKQKAIESQMKPLTDYATSVTFDPKLDEGLYLIGVGVRKKSIISVYAVSMYSSANVIEVLSHFSGAKHQRKGASSALRTAARAFGPSTPSTTIVSEMVYSAGAEMIAGAIAESVKSRYDGSPSDINTLESLIIRGVNAKGGQASKGTIFRFDCSDSGVSVSVDGTEQGVATFEGMGRAFVDVFMDDNAVSPTLVDSCVDNWSAVSLM